MITKSSWMMGMSIVLLLSVVTSAAEAPTEEQSVFAEPVSWTEDIQQGGSVIWLQGSCSATADCVGPDVSCSTTSGSCSFQDQSCSLGRAGWVKCGSQQIFCDEVCPCNFCTSNSQCNQCCPSGFGTCENDGTCTCMF